MRRKRILDLVTAIFFLSFVSGIGGSAFGNGADGPTKETGAIEATAAEAAGGTELAEAAPVGTTVAPGPAPVEGGQASKFFLEVPLGHEQLELMQRTVANTAREQLVGRKFIKVYGPLGAGTQSVPWDTYLPPGMANLDVLGEAEERPVHTQKRATLSIPQIYKDFILYGRDIAASSQDGGDNHCKCNGDNCSCIPLDLSAMVSAAVQCAKKEDDMVFNGVAEMGIPGLTTVEGRNVQSMKDWSVLGNGFQDAVEAVSKLTATGFYGPYAMVVSPRLYALLHRVYEKTGVLEIHSVRALMKGGVFQSNVLKKDVAVVIAMGQNNVDLVVGQDMRVSYWGPANLNHRFRVWESAALRIKCPQAICTIE